jgi:hypothetical protein
MEVAAPPSSETRVTSWVACAEGPWHPTMPHGGFAAYRIWQRVSPWGWEQRHEWKRADGSTAMDPWIRGAAGWCPGAVALEA